MSPATPVFHTVESVRLPFNSKMRMRRPSVNLLGLVESVTKVLTGCLRSTKVTLIVG